MSTTIGGYQTRILWGKEATNGTPIAGTILWDSGDSDSLTAGETPFDFNPLRDARTQLSQSYRPGQNLPGGALAPQPFYLDGSSTHMLDLLNAHFQDYTRGTVYTSGTLDIAYSYDFTHATAQVAKGTYHTLTFVKDTGITKKNHVYTSCIFDELVIGWEVGGPLMMTPTIKALAFTDEGTISGTPTSPPTMGFIQAPNMAVTWDGTTIQPQGFDISSLAGGADKQGPSDRGRESFVLGDVTGNIELRTWRDENFYANFLEPYKHPMTVGTFIVSGTLDTGYGTFATVGSAISMSITAYCVINETPDMAVVRGDAIETVNLRLVGDAAYTVRILSNRSANI